MKKDKIAKKINQTKNKNFFITFSRFFWYNLQKKTNEIFKYKFIDKQVNEIYDFVNIMIIFLI